MKVYVSNKQVSSRQYTLIYILLGDQCIVYLFVGHVNRHWGAFAKRCINNRTIRPDAKGAVPIVYCLRKMHLWGLVSCMQVIPFLCVFILDGALFGDDAIKFVSGLNTLYDRRVAVLRWGLGVVPAITYHCNAVPVINLTL